MIAHSYGSYIALKLAEILEANGKTGHVTFIDGSPLMIKTIACEYYKVRTDDAIQKSVIGHILSTVFTDLDDEFVKNVSSEPTWEGKVDKIAHFSDAKKIYAEEFMRLMLIALLNRVKIILDTDIKISNIVNSTSSLIRPNTSSVANISENYDLDINFKNPVEVMFLDGNHITILENPSLVEVLNNLHATIAS